MGVTYSQADWQRAQAEWDAGKFSDEWDAYRVLAARRGFIFPPSGDRFDSWEDDSPSQRAMLIRAIRETPELLSKCIGRSSSWHDVIRNLTGERDDWRRRMAEEDEPERPDPAKREAVQQLGEIMRRASGGAS